MNKSVKFALNLFNVIHVQVKITTKCDLNLYGLKCIKKTGGDNRVLHVYVHELPLIGNYTFNVNHFSSVMYIVVLCVLK